MGTLIFYITVKINCHHRYGPLFAHAQATGALDAGSRSSGAGAADLEMATISEEITKRYKDVDSTHVVPLVHLSAALIDSKHKIAADAAEILELQCRLDERESELEELNAASSKARAEHIRKAEASRQEAEDKVSFLLQQLRQAEARTLETGSILRRSQSRDRDGISANSGNQPQGGHSLLSSVHLGSVARENLLSRESSFVRDSHDSLSTKDTSVISEAERQRIEALEKRNTELVRELRTLRRSSQPQDGRA